MIVDILVLIVLLISAFIAFLRGFIREVLTIAGVLGGLAAAYFLGPKFAPLFHGWLGVEKGVEPERLFGIMPYNIVGDILAHGAVFITVVILLSLVSHFLAESAKSLGLGAIDRTLGVIFGIIRGALLLGLLYLPVYMLVDQETKDQWFSGSKTHFYLEKSAGFLHGFLPDSAVQKIEDAPETLLQGNEAREKLKSIDLLKGDKIPEEGAGTKSGEGYNEQFRDKMDQLFEGKIYDEKTGAFNE